MLGCEVNRLRICDFEQRQKLVINEIVWCETKMKPECKFLKKCLVLTLVIQLRL